MSISKIIKRKDREAYYSVTEETKAHYLAYPYGGGFQLKIPKTDVVEVDDINRKKQNDYATIDDGDKWYPCVANPLERWNGWALPDFTRKTTMKIMKDKKHRIVSEDEKHIIFEYDQSYTDGTSETFEDVIYKLENGLYSIGAGWCWSLKSDWSEESKIKRISNWLFRRR